VLDALGRGATRVYAGWRQPLDYHDKRITALSLGRSLLADAA
jgi:hypothetical protein